MTFKSLLPVHLTKELEPYTEAFDFALDPKNKDITNIAVTGNYGAGKSSVISSYFREQSNNILVKAWIFIKNKIKRKKTLTISLANFVLKNPDTKNTDSTDENVQKIQNIEFSILQQLLHKAHPNKLPKSRFERIVHKYSKSLYLSVFINLIYIVMFVLSLLLISNWSPLVDKLDFTDFYKQTPFLLVPIILLIALMYYLVAYLVGSGFVNKQDIQSIDLLKGQATFKNKREQSVLNLFLDEILYFFEATRYTTIIFEDLDRLEHKEIFIRLREINHIINSSDQVKRPIKFIYAVKDDLFETQESRVKFFDFIIPIIPVMDFDNSYTLITQEISRENNDSDNQYLLEALDYDLFLRDISSYINDMRLLVNIVNEYKIYLKKEIQQHKIKLNTIDQDRLRKIFALIVYKNLMPDDFSLIKSRQSILCQFIEHHRQLKFVNIINTLNVEQINQLKKSISQLILDEKQEVINLRLNTVKQLVYPQINDTNSRSPNYTVENLTDDLLLSLFDKYYKNQTSIESKCYLQPYGSYNSSKVITPEVPKEEVKSIFDEYDQKYSNINKNYRAQIKVLEKQISTLENKIKQFYSLFEVIEILRKNNENWDWNYYCEQFFSRTLPIDANDKQKSIDTKKAEKNTIIFMLMRNGYVDENYMNYLSLSHENSQELIQFYAELSNKSSFEKTFSIILSQTSLTPFLTNQKSILKEYANREAILNAYLIHHLIRKKRSFTGNSTERELLALIIKIHFPTEQTSSKLNFIYKYIEQCFSTNDVHTKEDANNLIVEIFQQPNSSTLQAFLSNIHSQDFSQLPEEKQRAALLILLNININDSNRNIVPIVNSLLLSIPDFITCFDYLGLHDQPADNVISWLQEAKIKINLTTPNTDTDTDTDTSKFSYKLFKSLVDNSLYHITDQNIQRIFEYDSHATEMLNTRHYSTICEEYNSDTAVRKYIEENISTYVNDILIAKKLSTQEKPENIISLINNKALNNMQRIELIKQNTSFVFEKNLSDIEFKEIIQRTENNISFGQQLLELDLEYREQDKVLIQTTWLNIYSLLSENEFLSHHDHAKWLNLVYNTVSEVKELDADQKATLKNVIIFNDQLSNDAYKHLVNLLQLEVTNGDLEELIKLQWEKIQILMELQLVKLSQESVDMIYETFINPTQEEEEND